MQIICSDVVEKYLLNKNPLYAFNLPISILIAIIVFGIVKAKKISDNSYINQILVPIVSFLLSMVIIDLISRCMIDKEEKNILVDKCESMKSKEFFLSEQFKSKNVANPSNKASKSIPGLNSKKNTISPPPSGQTKQSTPTTKSSLLKIPPKKTTERFTNQLMINKNNVNGNNVNANKNSIIKPELINSENNMNNVNMLTSVPGYNIKDVIDSIPHLYPQPLEYNNYQNTKCIQPSNSYSLCSEKNPLNPYNLNAPIPGPQWLPQSAESVQKRLVNNNYSDSKCVISH